MANAIYVAQDDRLKTSAEAILKILESNSGELLKQLALETLASLAPSAPVHISGCTFDMTAEEGEAAIQVNKR